MEFGKVADLSTVDFSLPPDAPETEAHLQHWPKPVGKASLYIGCTGWSMKEWVGNVYPPNAKAKDYLLHYGRQFNTIELNTTHYRIPDAKTIEKWKTETPADFRFCPKVLQTISHSHQLGFGTGLVLQFAEAIQGLDEKLGCCFLQLPPYFGVDKLPILERFLEHFPTHIPLAVEARHESWFDNTANTKQLFRVLEQHRVATVITDVAGRRDVLHMHLTTPVVLIRFVGNGLHESDYKRIDDWVQRLKKWIAGGVEAVYFFTHEPDNILAPKLADYLFQQAQQHLDVTSRGPQFFTSGQNEQMTLF